ncbi:MAG: T9SS type A sorting domain-containing protein [Ignavibacteria bacterium]
MKKLFMFFVLMFATGSLLIAQTPSYFNFDNGTTSNSFPLNQPAGKLSQTVVPSGAFVQPTPAPSGNITKLYFRISSTYPLGPATYSTFKIMLLHVADSIVTSGSFITGAWDTVYKRDTVTLAAGMNTWLEFTLDHPFAYNPAQSLAICMEQCGATGTTSGYSLRFTTATGNRRVYSGTTGCPHTYSGVSTGIINCGVTISSGPATLTYPTNVCNYGALPLYPSGVWAHGTEVLGDTLYIVGGGSAGSASTTVQRYAINTNTFSAGTVLPESKASAPLVKAGNSLYLIGGGSSVSTNGTTCYKYTPGAGWTSIAPLPTGLSGHGAVCWGDSVIFVMGGPYSSPSTNVYYYRVATNTWGTSTACLAARRTAAYGIVGNKLIIMAGYNAAFYKNVQIGTINSATSITWAAGPDVPGVKTGSSRPGGIGVGERFYFVPGETTPAPYPVDSIFVFNVTTNTWLPDAYTGRGVAGTGSNYWDAVSAWVAGSGKVKIFIAGGALGTAFPGLYTLQVDNCTVLNVTGTETPVTYNLSQNYPNPFNPVTKINYALPKQGLVSMKVYDILGKEVATLVNEVKNAGNYSVEFNASHLSSGIYFYKISVNGFSEVKKMTLIK